MYLDVQGTTSSYHNSDGICYFEVWDSSRPLCFFRRPLCDGLRAVSSINTLRLARLMDTTISARYPAVHICRTEQYGFRASSWGMCAYRLGPRKAGLSDGSIKPAGLQPFSRSNRDRFTEAAAAFPAAEQL